MAFFTTSAIIAGAAVVGATAAVVGTVQANKAAKAQAAAQQQSMEAQQQQQTLQVRRSQRAAIRQQQIQQAQLRAGALGMGVTGGSALAGGGASLASQTGEALGFGSQMSGLSRRITMFNQQAVDYGTRAQTAGAIASLGGQLFSAAGGFSAFGTPNKAGQPDASALLQGVGQ